MNQFSIITELLGTPPDDVIKTIGSENVRQETLLLTTFFVAVVVPYILVVVVEQGCGGPHNSPSDTCLFVSIDSALRAIVTQARKDSSDDKVSEHGPCWYVALFTCHNTRMRERETLWNVPTFIRQDSELIFSYIDCHSCL